MQFFGCPICLGRHVCRGRGYLGFPQSDLKTRLTNAAAMPATKTPPIRRRFGTMIKDKMVERNQRVVEEA